MSYAALTVDLNGGDAVTADANLKYKIYGSADGYTTAIHTTGKASEDADVSVSSGVATIVNVDVGTELAFKVSTIDEAGNESTPSAIFDAASTSEFPNFTFDGVVLDTDEWEVINPDPSMASFSQSSALIGTIIGSSTPPATRSNRVQSIRDFSSATIEFDLNIETQGGSGSGLIFYNPTTGAFAGFISKSNSGASIIRYYTASSGAVNTSLPMGTNVRLRVVYNGATCDFYYYDGSVWQHLTEETAALGNVKIALYSGGDSVVGSDNSIIVDNLIVSDYVEV